VRHRAGAQAAAREVADLFDGYASDAPLDPLVGPETSQMLLAATHSSLELEPKHQEALVRLAPRDRSGELTKPTVQGDDQKGDACDIDWRSRKLTVFGTRV
jgi:hypothetical protein